MPDSIVVAPAMPGLRVKELVPGLFYRRHITLLFGEPYAGKTRFSLKIFYHLSAGLPYFWGQIPPLRTFLGTERTEDEVRDQLTKMGIYQLPPGMMIYSLGDKPKGFNRKFRNNPFAQIEPAIEAHKPDIIGLDPLMHFMHGKTDFNSYGNMMGLMMDYREWVYSQGRAALLTHHMNKPKEEGKQGGVLNRALGSQAIVGSTTCAWALELTDQVKRDFVKATPFSHQDATSACLYFATKDLSQVDAATVSGSTEAKALRFGKVENLVLALATKEWQLVRDIGDALPDINTGSIANALASLEEKGLIQLSEDPVLKLKTFRLTVAQ